MKKKYSSVIIVLIGIIFLSAPYLIYGSVPVGKNISAGDYNWDISPFGELCYWTKESGALGNILGKKEITEAPQVAEDEWNLGVWWQEARDISHIEIEYEDKVPESLAKETRIQYWFKTWPEEAPEKHTIEDPMDDPWQGEWLTANTDCQTDGNKVKYSFQPITREENKLAGNLPEPVSYRRTLKVRLVYGNRPPGIKSLRVISPAVSEKLALRIELGCDKPVSKVINGKLEIYNGKIENVSGWKWNAEDKFTSKDAWEFRLNEKSKGIIADITAAVPVLPGSNDITIVTVRSSDYTFSFQVKDLKRGPIYIPAYSAYITLASDTIGFVKSNVVKGQTIREKLREEPEQTYDRACREIPKLDVITREYGGRLYLPLAADASWQKFGFEWGGGFFMSKNDTKAKGKEAARCLWNSDRFNWSIGTGKEPIYNRDNKTSHMSVLNDYLPVPQVNWDHEGLIYQEEAFATLLEGPLSPDDVSRDEQTPAILMVKLNISNPTNEQKSTYVWLKGEPITQMLFRDLFIMDQQDGKFYIRAKIKLPEDISPLDLEVSQGAIKIPVAIPANQTMSLFFSFPFVGDLTADFKDKFLSLDYFTERQRVILYWRDIVNEYVAFNVPERKFNEMARSVIPHIRMSTTKDPKSGLFMVPAASFGYMVFANESAFQTVYLDRIGDHQTVAGYLETFLKLQGRESMLGTYTGDQSAVFHGAKVDSIYNYTHQSYNLDHGTVLWGLAQHYLMSGDNEWLNHAAPNMLLAADWIIEQRSHTKVPDKDGMPVLHYGLLPAGQLEDNSDWGFWFAVNAYAHLGLQATAEAFKKAELPDAARLEREAKEYLDDLREAVKRCSELAPVVRLRNNTYTPYVPTRAYQRFRYFGPMKSDYYSRYKKNPIVTYRLTATREALYGPMILITTGVLDPFDPLAEAILDDWEDNITLSGSLGQHIHGVVDDEYWFSRGGMVFQPNLQNPIQAYLLRNEIPAAIRNIYNSMVSCLYRDVNAFTEEYRRWGVGSGPMYKIPDEARFMNRVMDMLAIESGDELWLASGTPRYWLEPGKIIKLYRAATIFGNVSFEMKSGTRPNTVEASVVLPENLPENKVKLFVRAPFEKKIKSVQINGKAWDKWQRDSEVVILPGHGGKINILIKY